MIRRLLAALGTAVLLTSCAQIVDGTPQSVFADPFKVGGLPATDGPTGLRDGGNSEHRSVQNSDNGKIDTVAALSVSDIEEYWNANYGESFDGSFTPVKKLISWDANDYDGVFCEQDTYALVNAAFCPLDRSIGWDRGELLPALRKAHGDMAITMVLAHEYGHSVQKQAQLNKRGTATLVAEQQADCFAGAYMRWVAEDQSNRFTLSTGDGLNSLLLSMISFRDPLLTDADVNYGGADQDAHGSAFERISAFQFGFTDGPSACKSINAAEIKQRRGELPVTLQDGTTGELPVTEESVRQVVDALNAVFKPADPPQLSFTTNDSCADARPSPPVSYCPATNTISVDLPNLAKLGALHDEDDPASPMSGDNTAYSVLMSRYMLSVQHAHGGLPLDTAEAGLRTACLTGVATTKLSSSTTAGDQTISLTAGDLDEAVSGLLSNGLAASNVNGDTVPAGFSRVDAFRTGVLGSQDQCIKRFP